MASTASPRTRLLTIVAQDPAVRDRSDRIVTAQVAIPLEVLRPGPWGHRVQVVDYDVSSDSLVAPFAYGDEPPMSVDPFADACSDTLVSDYGFHAQNVYAIVMQTLARFEQALGRHVSWAGQSHQLKIVPHAFAEANAYYSRDDEALLFGYFPGSDGRTIFTCLSHDVVAHETTHALLDGLCGRFADPSSPDQAAFHEGFADVVALLSVFTIKRIAEEILSSRAPKDAADRGLIPASQVSAPSLRECALLGLAEEMGKELQVARGQALRQSATLKRSPRYYEADTHSEYAEFLLPHRRGEILVAAVMDAFVEVWAREIGGWPKVDGEFVDLHRVAEEGEKVADLLLTMAIRALDYMPPVHIQFPDYLSAILTADLEIRPDDSRYHFRDQLRDSFAAFGIQSATTAPVPTRDGDGKDGRAGDPKLEPEEPGAWIPSGALDLTYDWTHFEPLTKEPDEVFHFVWENRGQLRLEGDLNDEAFSRVLSVRPALRIAADGFALRETVADFYQVIRLRASELKDRGFTIPADLPPDTVVPLYGGGTMIFDDYGRLKYYVHNDLCNRERQSKRLADLWSRRAFRAVSAHQVGPSQGRADFATLHRARSASAGEEW